MDRKFVLTFAGLFFLFTLAHSRSPLDPPGNDVITAHATVDMPEPNSKTKNGILLPSEKPEFGSEKVVEVEPEAKPSKLPETVTWPERRAEPLERETQSSPLTFINFRPINRHFPRRPFIPFFRHGHRCRHHHHHLHRFAKSWGPRLNGREIPYGDDMIVPGKDNVLDFHPSSRGVARQIPRRWTSFRHDWPRFPYMHDLAEREEEMRMKRPHHHYHHRFHPHEEREEAEGKEEIRKQEHEEGGLLKKIRKFLDHF
uniref:Uncharacterized protein LOC103404356 n=1 Tax=Rhizophora mucronata TaxID=61149 RepID=A0A2P2JQ28_RHIMU